MPTLFGLSNTSTHLVWLWRYQWYRKYMTDKCSMTFSSIMVTLSTYCWWMKWNLSLALPAMSFVCCLQYESKLWVTAHTQISLLPWQTVLELQHWSSETEVDHKVGFSSLYVCTCAWVRHRERECVCVCVCVHISLLNPVRGLPSMNIWKSSYIFLAISPHWYLHSIPKIAPCTARGTEAMYCT